MYLIWGVVCLCELPVLVQSQVQADLLSPLGKQNVNLRQRAIMNQSKDKEMKLTICSSWSYHNIPHAPKWNVHSYVTNCRNRNLWEVFSDKNFVLEIEVIYSTLHKNVTFATQGWETIISSYTNNSKFFTPKVATNLPFPSVFGSYSFFVVRDCT